MCVYLFSRKNRKCVSLLGTVHLFVLTKQSLGQEKLYISMLQMQEKLSFLENIRCIFQQKHTCFFLFCSFNCKTLCVLFISLTVASMCAYSGLCIYLLQHVFRTCILIWACASIRISKVGTLKYS